MRTLWALIWFIVLSLGSIGTAAVAKSTAASVQFTFAYDGQTRPTTAYDGPSASPIGYDAARKHAAYETRNATTGSRVLFAPIAEFLAAETTATQLEFGFARGASIQTPGLRLPVKLLFE